MAIIFFSRSMLLAAAGVNVALALEACAGWVSAPAAQVDRVQKSMAFTIPPRPGLSQMVVFDADGDGDLDVWNIAYDRGVAFRNVGTPRNPSWARMTETPFPASIPTIFQAAPTDMDGDGDPDFLVTFATAQYVLRWIRNTGTRAMPVWEVDPIQVSFPGGTYPGFRAVPVFAVGDLDADAIPDLVIAGLVLDGASSSGVRLKVYRSERVVCPGGNCWGPLAFLADLRPAASELVDSTNIGNLHIADLNGDGAPEIVAAGSFRPAGSIPTYYGLVVLPNTGTPTAPAWGQSRFSFVDPNHPDFHGLKGFETEHAAFADIDADGDLDLFTAEGFFQNRGTPAQPVYPDTGDLSFFSIRAGTDCRPVCEDVDLDGDPDLLLMGKPRDDGEGRVRLLRNDGTRLTPVWTSATNTYGQWLTDGSSSPRFADLDGDGDRDAWFALEPGIFASLRSGSPDAPQWSPMDTRLGVTLPDRVLGYYGFDFADIDRDGDLDLLETNASEGILLYRNTGTPTTPDFALDAVDFLGFKAAFPAGNIRSPMGCDLNGDGRLDVAVVQALSFFSIRVLAAMGNASGFDPPVILVDEFPSVSYRVELADLNGDGLADLLCGDLNGGVRLFLQTGAPVSVVPDRGTLVPGEARAFTLEGGTASGWSFVTNASGGTVNPATGEYTAGPAPGVDVIQAFCAGGERARTFINVIPASESAAFGKAVLIAGAKGATDPAWPATDHMSRKAYDALRLRGYTKENILFLNFQPGRDLDGNGLDDDIDGPATGAAAAAAFTTFATNATRLVVGLWDHGASGGAGDFMRLNPSETLSAAQLGGWLDAWQAADTNRECGVVLEFCQSGGFLDDLANGASNRFVAASCATNQLAYFIAQGLVSFSDSFFSGVVQGLDFGACFDLARGSMSAYQSAQLDDNGDGVYTRDTEGVAASSFQFGARQTAGRNVPQVARISPNQDASGSAPVTLWAADIASPHAITRVWAVVVPPTHQPDPALANPVTDLPEVDLSYNPNTGRYEADFAGFSEPGSYAVIFFAQDVWGGVSVPRQSYITQSGLTERVILAGGQSDDPVTAAGIRDASRLAYATLRARRIPAANIRWLSATAFEDTDGDTTNDVHAAVSSAALQDAVQNWSAGVDRLTLLVIAEGTNNLARLSGPSDLLAAASLKAWLDAAAATNQIAQMMLDFSGAGAFIPALNPPPAGARMVLASSAPGRFSVIEPGVSLTSVVMSEIFAGRSVGAAVASGRKIMRRLSGGLRQLALLDSDSDGVANRKNIDDPIARAKYLGAGFVTGNDSPVIGRVTPDLISTGTPSVVLFAEDVVDADGIASVWAEIAGPDSVLGDATRRVDLAPVSPSRWEAVETGITNAGLHAVAFFAEDLSGNRSAPVVARIERVAVAAGAPADVFEPDDDPLLSRIADLPLDETHTLHAVADEDWVRFYASSSLVYDIATTHLTNTLDTVLEIYSEGPGGVLTLVDRVDDFGADEGEWTGLDFPVDGIYAVRVTHASGEPFAPGAYQLSITVPAGLLNGITVYVIDALGTNPYIASATVRFRTSGGALLATRVSNGSGIAEYATAPGNYRVEVIPPAGGGFMPYLGPESASFPVASSEFKTNPVTHLTGVGRSSLFFKAASVTGRVETATPGEAIPGAPIRLLGADGTFTRYPATSAGTLWVSDGAGGFPRAVVVPAGPGYSVEVGSPGYLNRVLSLGALTAGETRNAGVLALAAADANANSVPDPWEFRWFSGLVDVSLDGDHDGLTHWQEYVAGTNPVLASSALQLQASCPPSSGVKLIWAATPGRRYRIRRMNEFSAGVWTEQYVSPVAAAGVPTLEWTDPDPPANAAYRLEAELP